jgi:hypothetical protein
MADPTIKGSPTTANFWAGIFMTLAAIIALVWLIPEFVSGANDSSKNLTPGFMPRVAAWCMLILGALVALDAWRVLAGKTTAIVEESEENEDLSFGRAEIVNTLIVLVGSAIYVAGLSLLGFVLPSTILLIFLIYLTGYRRKLVLVIVAIAFPLTLELLLWHILKVPLPQFPLVNF